MIENKCKSGNLTYVILANEGLPPMIPRMQAISSIQGRYTLTNQRETRTQTSSIPSGHREPT
jgi:hypothetical protein